MARTRGVDVPAAALLASTSASPRAARYVRTVVKILARRRLWPLRPDLLWHDRRIRVALASAVAFLAAPGVASAVTPTMTVRDVPLHSARSLASSTPRFNM